MADYLPLYIEDIIETTNRETGELRKSAVCKTVQPETINLNLTRVDADRISQILNQKGKVLMIPIRRGEIEGRAFTSIAPGVLIPVDLPTAFTVKPVSTPLETKPEPDSEISAKDVSKPLFGKSA